MSQMSNWMENKLADFARGQGLTLPTNWYVALGSAAVDGAFTELSGTGYARELIARSLVAWSGTQGAGTTLASTGTSHITSNNAAIDFGISGSAWGTASAVGLYDASSGGNFWMWIDLEDVIVIGNGDPVEIEVGALGFTLGVTGGMSDYLSNKLIDLIWRAQAYTWPTALHVKLMTSSPTNAGGGTEVSGGAYARAQIDSNMTEWSGTQGVGTTSASSGTNGRISNNDDIVFPIPTASWGTVTHGGLDDAASAGNLMFWRALSAPKTVNLGSPAPSYTSDSLGITFA